MAYIVRADIETAFGKNNVAVWADLNDNKVGAEIATKITAAIADVDAWVDDELRGGPFKTLPLSPVPLMVKRAAALQAGVFLYESRGVQTFEVETGQPQHRLLWARQEAHNILKRIRQGNIRIDDATNERTSTPDAVAEAT